METQTLEMRTLLHKKADNEEYKSGIKQLEVKFKKLC
jgi:hypothetical protein